MGAQPFQKTVLVLIVVFLRSAFGTLCFMCGLLMHGMVLAGRVVCSTFPPVYRWLYKASDECQPFGETPKR